MKQIQLTVQHPGGETSVIYTAPGEYTVGSSEHAHIRVRGEGVAAEHVVLVIEEALVHVQPLGDGVLVNSHASEQREEVPYPASVEFAGVSLMLLPMPETQLPPLRVGEPGAEIDFGAAPTLVPDQPAFDPSTAPTILPEVDIHSAQTVVPAFDPSTAPTILPEGFVRGGNAHGAWKTVAPLRGAYRLVKEIARGGMGKIFFGEDPQLKREVAVKVSSLSDGGEDARFLKEAEVLAQLAHPNIVPIHAIGVDTEGRPYYSMKLVKGRTLQAILKALSQKEPEALRDYPLPTLLTIFRKVCDAMAFAHSKRILHRDLKPENIMVGEYGEVLVMDWGLAKTLGVAEERTGLTQYASSGSASQTDMGLTMEGDVMGTPQYMSPEQAEGMVAELDPRSDVYSLGGVLYALLTLRPPIEGKTVKEVLGKVKSGQISSMITKRGDGVKVEVGSPAPMERHVPEALRAVTLKAMSLDRAKRYGSVEEFAAELEAYQNGFATKAEHAGALRQLVLLIKRNKAVSGLVALLLVAACGFVVRLGIEKKQAQASERRALASEQDARTSEQRALANEQKAREAGEASRRQTANAMMSLAEAAEATSDSPTLKGALAAVPEDLRTLDWGYFQRRVDTTTFTIQEPMGASSWKGFDDWPSEPDRMLALSSDGMLSAVHLPSGTLQPLWKFNPKGAQNIGPIAVSRDGHWIALAYRKGETNCVEIRELPGGTVVGSFANSDPGNTISQILVSADSCVLCIRNGQKGSIEVWDYRASRRLWATEGSQAEYGMDGKSIFVAHAEKTERRDAISGEITAAGASESLSASAWFTHNSMGTEDWKLFFSQRRSGTGLRKVDPWTGKVYFEIAPPRGNFAAALIPTGDFFVTLGPTSAESGLLEIRSSRTGELSRSLPFLASFPLYEPARRICSKPDCLAVRIGGALKIFKLENIKPSLAIGGLGGTGGARLSSSKTFLAAKTGELFLLEADGKTPARSVGVKVPNAEFWRLQASSDGRRAVATGDKGVYAFRIDTRELEEIWQKRSGASHCLTIHPTEDRIWTSRAVFEFSTGRELVSIKGRERLPTSISPVWVGASHVAEIAYAAQKSEEGTGGAVQLALWSLENGELTAKTDAPRAVAICASPDGRKIAEAGSDKRVRIRDAITLEIEREVRAHESALTGIAWHPLLPILVTRARDGMIRVWDIEGFKKLEEWSVEPRDLPKFDDSSVRIEITPDGRELTVYDTGAVTVFRPLSFGAPKKPE